VKILSDKLSYYEKAMKHPIASRWHKNCINLVKSLMSNKSGLRHLDVGCGNGVRIRMIVRERSLEFKKRL